MSAPESIVMPAQREKRMPGVALLLVLVCISAAALTVYSAWEYTAATQVARAFASAQTCGRTVGPECLSFASGQVVQFTPTYDNPKDSSSGIAGYSVKVRFQDARTIEAVLPVQASSGSGPTHIVFGRGSRVRAEIWRSKIVALTPLHGQAVRTQAYPFEDLALLGIVVVPLLVTLGSGAAAIASKRSRELSP